MQKCLISNLYMALHFLLLILNALVSLFLFLKSGLQVMKDLLQLLLSGSQACSHLLCLCKQLCLCLKLLCKDVLLFEQLHRNNLQRWIPKHRFNLLLNISLSDILTCWFLVSISTSCPSTLVCFSFTLTSSSSLACISSSCLVTCSRGFTYKMVYWTH